MAGGQREPTPLAAEDARDHELRLLAASTIERARGGMRSSDPAERAHVAREATGVLRALSLALEGERAGELARSAKLLAREADEAERQARQRTRQLQRRVLCGFAAALCAPNRRESDFTRIVRPLTNLMYAHHLKHKAARDAQRANVPAQSQQLKQERQR